MSTKHRGVRGTPFSRRRLLRSAAVGGAGLAALAAGGRSTLSGLAAAAAQDKVTITFWTPGGSPTYCDVQTQIAADYGQVNPNVTVNFQCGTGQEEFAERFLSAIAAGNPPDATVEWDTPVSLGVQGALLPIDEMMANAQYAQAQNWPEAVLKSCQFGGKTYGLPVTAGAYGIWYNQDMLEAKGIPSDRASFPKTWDDFRALSKEFVQWDGDRLVTAGYVPYFDDLKYQIPIWAALNGSQIYDAANQRYTIDAEPNVAMVDYFVSWVDEQYQGDVNKVKRSGAWASYPSEEGQPPEFQAGNLLAVQQGSWVLGDLYAYGDVKLQKWDVAPHPVGPGGKTVVSGYWPNWLVIPKGAKHPAEAFGYLDYMSGVGVTKWFAAVPDMPANKLVENVVPQVTVEKRGAEFAADIMKFFQDQLASATPMWDSPVQSVANDQLGRALERAFTKQATPKDALAEAQQACQAELEKVLAGNQ